MSQKSILTGAIKRKSQSQSEAEPDAKKLSENIDRPSALKCIAVLPGLGNYDSSDSDDSSNIDDEMPMDLCTGRKLLKKNPECE